MKCLLFGHANAPDCAETTLEAAITDLFKSKDVSEYLVGNNGNFDYMAQKVLKKLEPLGISHTVVLSKINEAPLYSNWENTIFPESLAKVPPRYAIVKRNELMVKEANCAICYVNHIASNSYKMHLKAIKKGLYVINIASKL